MKLTRTAAYWVAIAYDLVRPLPHWTVTWPTLPGGIYSIPVRRADNIEHAVQQARAAFAPTAPGYSIAYDYEPEVWQIKPGPACRISGPEYCDNVAGKAGTP